MTIGIYPNQYKDKKYNYTRRIIKYLNSKGIVPISYVKIGGNIKYTHMDYKSMLQNVDYLIALGGDGTLLSVAVDCADFNIPVLLINLGTLGYLANVEKDEIFLAMDKLIDSDFTIDKRVMLESNYEFDDDKIKSVSLNEFVVTKGLESKLVSVEVYISGKLMGLIRGDGVIVSTPTGSTGYNITAGGSILSPSSETFIITPICPQTPSFPLVISADETVKLKLTYRSASDVALVGDGKIVRYIQNDEEIIIKKAEKYVNLIRIFDKNHFEVFQSKYFHNYR